MNYTASQIELIQQAELALGPPVSPEHVPGRHARAQTNLDVWTHGRMCPLSTSGNRLLEINRPLSTLATFRTPHL